MTLSAGEVVRRLEALVGLRHVPEDSVRFRMVLLRSQAAALEVIEAAGGGEVGSIDPGGVRFDVAILKRMLGEILEAGGGRGGEESARLAAAEGDRGLLGEIARAAAFGPDSERVDSLAAVVGVPGEAVLFFGRVMAAPFVTAAVRRLRKGAGARLPGRCPSCGSHPGLAKLRREEGRRIPFCSLGGGEWESARVECPFCGDGNSLARITVGADDPQGVEGCGRCGGYLKVVDERMLPEGEIVVPLVEDVGTLCLHIIAER